MGKIENKWSQLKRTLKALEEVEGDKRMRESHTEKSCRMNDRTFLAYRETAIFST
jgi:hypothetical protein